MDGFEPTSWQMILAAGAGDRSQRRRFAERYEDLIRGCLRRRWRGSARVDWVDDVSQEVFFECFRDSGVLAQVRSRRPQRFRAYLFGVIQNVARAVERQRVRGAPPGDIEAAEHEHATTGEGDLLSWFEREWARTVIAESLRRLASLESGADPATAERSAAKLLELRFERGMPIRAIAEHWGVPSESVHRDYARARREFSACLRAVVGEHDALTPTELEDECRRLTTLLG